MNVTIVGPLLDASGYAYHTRTIALGLHRLGVQVHLRGVPWGSAQISPPARELTLLRQMQGNPDQGPILYITVANMFQKDPHRPTIGWTMLETDRIPPLWRDLCNALDEVWVPTEFNRETFTRSGVDPGKVQVVPLGTDPERFRPGIPPLHFPGRRRFAFFSNFEWIARKGYEILLRAYLVEFSWHEDVSLIIKTYDNSAYDPEGRAIRNQIRQIAAEVGRHDPPHVILLTRVVPPEQVPALYAAADCYVLTTRGEGWNHPAMEAAACGVPVITTAWSGHLAFLHDGNSYLIPIHGLEPVPAFGIPNDAVYGGSAWAVPSLEETRRLMRHVFLNREEARAKAQRAREEIVQRFTWEQSVRQVIHHLSKYGH